MTILRTDEFAVCLRSRSTAAVSQLLRLTACCALSALCWQARGDTLEEVTVFGARLEERNSYLAQSSTVLKSDTALKDLPLAVTAITRALLDDQQPMNLGEALRNVAGYQPQQGFGALNSRPRLRGFIPSSFLKSGFRQASFYADVDIATIAQIEVLKGPASALYGRFEPGGVINIVPKRPLEKPYAAVQLTTGSDQYYRGTLDAGGPLTQALLYRLNLVYEDSESYRDFFGVRKGVIAPAIEWRASDATTVLVELQAVYRDGGFDRGYFVPSSAELGRLLLELPVSRNLGEPTDETLYRGTTGSIIVDHRLNPRWQLRAGAFASDISLEDNFFSSGSPVMPNATTYNRRMLYATDKPSDHSFSLELAGTAATGGIAHKLLFGVDAGEERYVYEAERVPVSSPLNPFAPVYGAGVYGPETVLAFAGRDLYRSAALFAQDEAAFGSRLRILIGGRYDVTEGSSRVRGTPDTENRRTIGEFSPRAGLTFAVTPAVSLYTNYARSFVPEIAGVVIGGRMTDPSHGKQIEVGLKTDLLNGRMFVTTAFYDLTKKNIVVSDPENPGFSIQVGEQQSRGAELELVSHVTDRWNVIASYAYNDAEITRDTNAGIVGNRIVNVPEHTASLWSTYGTPLPAEGTLEIGFGAFYVSERAVNNANLFFLPGYTRFDALAAYELANWRLALNLQNLTGKKYFDSAGGVFHPMPPRQWFVSAGYHF